MKLPSKALKDLGIQKFAAKLKISYFRGVFIRDTLPKKIGRVECVIVNIDYSCGQGTN